MRALLRLTLCLYPLFAALSPTAAATSIPASTGHTIYLPAVSGAPAPLKVLSSALIDDVLSSGGDKIIVGEMINQSDSVLYQPYATAVLYDAAGDIVAMGGVLSRLPQVLPGQRVPLRSMGFLWPAAAVGFSLIPRKSTYVTPGYYPIAIVAHRVDQSDGTTVSGEARYETEKLLVTTRVIVTFYDAAGAVVDVVHGVVTAKPFLAGTDSPFRVHTPRAVPFASYSVVAFGLCY